MLLVAHIINGSLHKQNIFSMHGHLYQLMVRYSVSYPAFTYNRFIKKRSQFILGIGLSVIFSPHPYPETNSKREEYVQNPKSDLRGAPYVPPFSFFEIPNLGYAFYLNTHACLKLSFTPLFQYYKPFHKFGVRIPWGGLSFNYILS